MVLPKQEVSDFQFRMHEDVLTVDQYKFICSRLIDSLRQREEELESWKELFYLLKSDREKLENFQTDDWKVKAKKMGLDI